MFNNITKTCSGSDATFEILTMLAGAFLLGCLLCWLLRTLRNKTTHHPKQNNFEGNGDHGRGDSTSGLETEETDVFTAKTDSPAQHGNLSNLGNNTSSRLLDKYPEDRYQQTYKGNTPKDPTDSAYSTPKIDDLTKISGVDRTIESQLKNEGIKSYTDLRDVQKTKLLSIMDNPGFKVPKREVETWPHQSSLAAKGEWKKLTDYQKFLRQANNVNSNTEKNAFSNKIQHIGSSEPTHLANLEETNRKDDLTRISEISENTQTILNKNGIYQYSDFNKVDFDEFKDELPEEVNIDSWKKQAELADSNDWDALEEYQDFLTIKKTSQNPTTTIAENKPAADSIDTEENTGHSANDNTHVSEDLDGISSSSHAFSQEGNIHKDDLKQIEGIGPKIEQVLNDNGISTFKQLSDTNRNTLKSYLDSAGTQFMMREPESWPFQANMAYRGEWQKLKEYQEFMLGGRDDRVSLNPLSSVAKVMGTTSSENVIQSAEKSSTKGVNYIDDLTKIEGIGPKIEQLLNEAGILNFNHLKNADRDTLKSILDNGGPQFKMHEPGSWPEQAELADNGEWQQLQDLQDRLIGGR